jgi:predicted nucleic acid-binding protein
MRAGTAALLLQTLAEYSHVAIRKAGIAANTVRSSIGIWQSALPVEAAVYDDLPAALDAVTRHGLSFWDAMLWATAKRIGVRYFLSEDLQDGRVLDRVRFINPFASENTALVERVLSLPGPFPS